MALAGAVNDAHSTASDLFEDLIVPKAPVLVGEIDFRERADERFRLALVARVEPALEQTADAKSAGDVRRGIATRTRGRIRDHAGEGVGKSGESHGRRAEGLCAERQLPFKGFF